MDKPNRTKTVLITFAVEIDADLSDEEIKTLIIDTENVLNEGLLSDPDDPSDEREVWTDVVETAVSIDGETVEDLYN